MTAARLRAAANTAVEGAALADEISLGLFNPTPETDSLLEHLLELRRYEVPVAVIRELIGAVRILVVKADATGDCHRSVAGELDRMLAQLRAAQAAPQIKDAITVRGLVRVLRDPLAQLSAPADHDTGTVVNARRTVLTIIRTTPRERLVHGTLRHELGANRHDTLLALVAEAVVQ